MKHSIPLFFAAISLLFFQCQSSGASADVPIRKYYDVAGFVHNQISLLKKKKPIVVKKMTIGAEKGNSQSNNVDWERELDLFLQSDINKRAYEHSYVVARPDSLKFVYTLKPGEKLPVQSLKVELDSVSKNPKRILAKFQTNNRLFNSEKSIEMNCADAGGEWLVRSYAVKGFQKLPISDKKTFAIQARLKSI